LAETGQKQHAEICFTHWRSDSTDQSPDSHDSDMSEQARMLITIERMISASRIGRPGVAGSNQFDCLRRHVRVDEHD